MFSAPASVFALSLSYLRRRPLTAALNVVLMALGIATIVVLLLASRQLEERLERDAAGIDLVVGAKGSPLQLVLSAVYHLDAPTGNVRMKDARFVLESKAVRRAVPMALGDTYAGHAIVGTTQAYLDLYGATVNDGRLWEGVREAVVGADVAQEQRLAVGRTFVSAHGLGGVTSHTDAPMTVVGIMGKTGTVLDRLVLTSIETVWANHDHDYGAADDGAAHDPHLDSLRMAEREITAIVVQLKKPAAGYLFARTVDGIENLKAAQPAFELARLFRLFGVGAQALQVFGAVLLATALLSLFVTLYSALEDRRYDVAMLRTLGASRSAVFRSLVIEGLLLAAMGVGLGLLLGHAAVEVAGRAMAQAQGLRLTGAQFLPAEALLALAALAVGVLAALLPAWRAYRSDVAATLAEG